MRLTGGCACGAFRYEVNGEPIGMAACHCKACQRRTGSAFGIGCFFEEKNVSIIAGEDNFSVFDRTSDAGRFISHRFCQSCGTTVMWKPERLPHGIAIAGGTFDETDWIRPGAYFWVSKAQAWFSIPDDMPQFEQNRTSN